MLRQQWFFTGLFIAAISVIASNAQADGGRIRGVRVYQAPTVTTGIQWQRNNWGVSGFGRNYGGPSNGYGGYYYGNSNYPIPGGFPAGGNGYRR